MIRITFVGDFVYNCGSAQTIFEYSKISKENEISISVSGYVDSVIAKKIPVVKKVNKKNTDIAIFILENVMYLDPNKYPERLTWYLENTNRRNRIVIDTDAKYKSINEIDTRTISKEEASYLKTWDLVIDELSNVVLQPMVELKKRDKYVYPFLFFAFPSIANPLVKKHYDVVYVGNNWSRENEMIAFLHSAIFSKQIKSVRINGKGWSKKEIESKLLNKFNLKYISLGLSVHNSVPPNALLKFMSKGLINPILVNKDLLDKKLVTPRMFETFAANTIPLLPDSALYTKKIYGEQSDIFFSPEEMMSRKIKDVFCFSTKYEEKRNEIRKHLKISHSFEKRFAELLEIISNL